MAKRSNGRLTPEELSGFCAEVALMLSAGMPLYDGVEALADAERSEIYQTLNQNVTQTGSLYQALKADSRWPKYLTEMAGVGERTGRLEQVMNGLAIYYEREGRIRGAIVSAVTYPLVLGIMMLLIVLVMIVKVLPVFRRVLDSMGVALNESGNLLMQVGTNAGWIVLVAVGLVVLAALVCVVLMRTALRPRVLHALRRVFPPLRRLSRDMSASRVASVLSMMLSGGFPLDEALEMVPNVLPDAQAAEQIQEIRRKITSGGAFADALAESGIFTPVHSGMIRMGIAAGREDQVMSKIAETSEEQVEEGISELVSIIEPTLVALLCLVIGAILLSVMLPMAGIISNII